MHVSVILGNNMQLMSKIQFYRNVLCDLYNIKIYIDYVNKLHNLQLLLESY